MTKHSNKLIRKKVHDHTVNCLVSWSDHGHGCRNDLALRSAERLIKAIEGLVQDEFEAGAASLAASGCLS